MLEHQSPRSPAEREYGGRRLGPAVASEEPVLTTFTLRQLLGLLRRQRWLLIAGFLAGVGFAFYLLPPHESTYSAQSSVRLVYERRALTSGIAGDPALDAGLGASNPIESQIQVLQSETVLTEVVNTLGLRFHTLSQELLPSDFSNVTIADAVSEDTFRLLFRQNGFRLVLGNNEVDAAYGESVDLGGVGFTLARAPDIESASILVIPEREAVRSLRRGLQVRQRERTDLIDVEFSGPDPVLAQRIVNAIAETARDVSGRFAQQQSRRRRLFLESQLHQADSALIDAQTALIAFRAGSEFSSARDQIGHQQSQLIELERRRNDLESERRGFAGFLEAAARARAENSPRLRDLLATPAVLASGVVSPLYAQLVQYETERATQTSGPWAKSESHPDVQRLDALIVETERNILTAARGHLASIDAQLSGIAATRSQAGSRMRALPEQEAEEMRLAQQVETVRLLSDQLRAEHQRARIAETVEEGQLEVLDLAGFASESTPRNTTKFALYVVLGLVLGGGAGFVREMVNHSVHGPDELQALLSVPELAVIPPIRLPVSRGRSAAPRWLGGRARTGSNGDPAKGQASALSIDPASTEAFRILRTNLAFYPVETAVRAIVVTSTDAGEGKTTTATNLAIAAAEQGQKVLLVDADLYRPRLHQLFQVVREPGLSQYLSGGSTREEVIQATVLPNLSLIPAGVSAGGPRTSLSNSVRERFRNLEVGFDLMVIDTPPLRGAADATFLSAISDGVILVVRAGRTDRDSLVRAMEGLRKVGARVVGTVLNDPDAEVPRYAGRYDYSYEYAASANGYA
jgi:polysaccharide biosynthesis transport protein